jgi:hypothetical protein
VRQSEKADDYNDNDYDGDDGKLSHGLLFLPLWRLFSWVD